VSYTGAFVAMSRFTVANGMEDEVHQAFLARPHLVDSADGFRGMDVLRSRDDPREFTLPT
jgi:heme-degrading monooxygenase HmoA